jgi:GTP-binding protein Era
MGETNAGKSTLINRLVGQKVSIVSQKVQTTLSKILGIVTRGDSQIIFIDTPGFSHNRKKCNANLEKIAWDAFREANEVMFVIDVCRKKQESSIALLQKIHPDRRVSLVMTKVDLIHKPILLEIAAAFNKIRNFEKVFMVSSLTGSGIDEILNYLESVVLEGEWLYDADQITDSPFEKYASEITREHVYYRLHQEIPYQCIIETEDYENKADGSIRVVQRIRVKNKAHKAIFIGQAGGKIKAIGEASRRELSELMGREVHLFLHVVVDEKHYSGKEN